MKNNSKYLLGVLALFGIGLLFGFTIQDKKIQNIQGYTYGVSEDSATDSNATDSNATDSNATDSNATDCNATDSNATDSNATDSNVSWYDDVLFLENFRLHGTKVNGNDKLYIDLETYGAMNTGASITFTYKEDKKIKFTAKVNDLENYPYVIIPNITGIGKFYVSSILLIGRNSDDTTFSKTYDEEYLKNYGFDKEIQIYEDADIQFKSITFDKTTVNAGGKVYVDVKFSVEGGSVTLSLAGDNNDVWFNVDLKSDENGKRYFIVPGWVEPDDYHLAVIELRYHSYISMFSHKNDPNNNEPNVFTTDINLRVLEGSAENFEFSVSDFSMDILKKMRELADNSNVTIKLNENTIVVTDLFEAIKGTNKTLTVQAGDNEMVFNGKGIRKNKTIDGSIEVLLGSEDTSEISKLIDNDYDVVNFADNGTLPGEATVKIRRLPGSKLGSKINVYYYNKEKNKFSLVKENVKIHSGVYVFNITHHSTYVLVNGKIDDSLIIKGLDNIVDFQKSNTTLLLIIIVGLLIAIIAVIVIKIVGIDKSKKENEINNKEVVDSTYHEEEPVEVVNEPEELEEPKKEEIEKTEEIVSNKHNHKKNKKYKKR